MNSTHRTRTAALIASILLTFGTVQLIANYALPAAGSTQIAQSN